VYYYECGVYHSNVWLVGHVQRVLKDMYQVLSEIEIGLYVNVWSKGKKTNRRSQSNETRGG